MERWRGSSKLTAFVAGVVLVFVTTALVHRFAPSRVTVASVTRGPAAEIVYATGTIDLPNHVVLRSRSSGTVTEVLVHEGEVVRQGQTLARLANPVVEARVRRVKVALSGARRRSAKGSAGSSALASQTEGARAELAHAREELSQLTRLAASGSIAPVEVRRARARVAQLQAQLQSSIASVRAHREDSTDQARELEDDASAADAQLEALEIKAPFDGIVLQTLLRTGDLVAEAQPAFSFAGRGEHVATLSVDEVAIGLVRARRGDEPGSPATVTVDALDRRTFPAEVIEVAPEADRERRAFRVKVRLSGENPELRSGMTAEANIEVRRNDAATLVPTEALDRDGVWVVEQAKARRKPVRIGIRDLRHTEVVAGLSAGERVIVGADDALREGSFVWTR